MPRHETFGWGRFPRKRCRVETPRTEDQLRAFVLSGDMIARGGGRSYGDSALNERLTVSMRGFNRMLDFDTEAGVLTLEAGVTLEEVILTALPRGYFPMVTPGTKFGTIGGLIAADVHGKNHHAAGSFGDHVLWLDLMTAEGEILRCSPEENADLFRLTIGGMGLTGVTLRAAIRLQPVESAWIKQKTIMAPNLAAIIDAIESHEHWTYSVAWIDCLAKGEDLGRSLLFLGEHARFEDLPAARRDAPLEIPTRKKLSVPFNAPSWVLNKYTVQAMNAHLYRSKSKPEDAIVDWDTYFYPLDAIHHWNRIYGRGFMQFQCVLPRATARVGLEQLLGATSDAGMGSFLAVLKLFGAQDSAFSFPTEGYTLTMDFPATRRAFDLMDRLDQIAVAHGGRFYLAKDARLDRKVFEASDDRIDGFREQRRALGAAAVFRSSQSERLAL